MRGRGNRMLRKLDRYLGVPLVFCHGMLRRSQSFPENVRRIGLLNTAAIGDTILMSAPLADIRAAYPASHICLLVGPSNYDAACLLNGGDSIIKLPVFDPLSAIVLLRSLQLDLLFDFGPWARLNAILSGFSGATFRVGFRTAGQYRHYNYDVAVDHLSDVHELDNYRRLLSDLDLRSTHRPRLAIERLQPALDDRPINPYVVFHLWPGGTGSCLKQWPRERWVKLAEHLVDRGFESFLPEGPYKHPTTRK